MSSESKSSVFNEGAQFDTRRTRLDSALAATWPWLVMGLLNAVIVALKPVHYGSIHTRVVQIIYDLGHHAFLASLGYAFGLTIERLPKRRRVWTVATVLAVGAVIVGCHSLAPDLVGLGERLAGRQIRPVPYLLAALAALGVPMAAVAGRLLGRRKRRTVAVTLAILLVAFNFRYLRGGHPGIHAFITLFVIALSGAAFVDSALPSAWSGTVRSLRRAVPIFALGGAFTILRAPDAEVQLALGRVETSILSPWADIIWSRRALPPAVVSEDLRPWFEHRVSGIQRAPSDSHPIAANPVVVLVTVDAFRADVLLDERYRDRLPRMNALRDNSVSFVRARSAAPDTRTSLAAIFTSKLFSNLPWTKLYSSIETYAGPYFPEVLTKNGVLTVNFAADFEIASKKRGIVRGFADERVMLPRNGFKFAVAHQVVEAMVARLRESPERAMFFYTHLGDPHAPYDLGGSGVDDQDSYLREIETIDRAIDELMNAMHAPEFAHRSVLILSADHGEFFGEHDRYYHGRTVYDDVVHVPLLINASGIQRAAIQEPVSLLDLGPTILDLFGLGWPSDFMGESLRPALSGSPLARHRPIPMQSRVDYGLVFPDGYKAMVNWSRNWEEVYDLNRDPQERLNLRDRYPVLAEQYLALLKHYFNTHAYLKPDGDPF